MLQAKLRRYWGKVILSEPRHARLPDSERWGESEHPRGTLRGAQKEKQRLRHQPPLPLPSPALCQTPGPHSVLLVASQNPASVLGPVKWSHSTHLAAGWRGEMRVWSSFCVPGGGTRRVVQAATAHHALRRPIPRSSRPPAALCPPDPRSQASYLAVMERRPAGGARRKGATAGPGEG